MIIEKILYCITIFTILAGYIIFMYPALKENPSVFSDSKKLKLISSAEEFKKVIDNSPDGKFFTIFILFMKILIVFILPIYTTIEVLCMISSL